MRTLIIFGLLILICATALGEGEHAPIFVVDSNFAPVAGAVIRAATWGSRPPSYVGNPAVERGNGAYYFKLGNSCSGCIPPGTYDVWRDGILDSAYAGVRLEMGDVPGPNTIGSSQIINASVRLDEDMKQDYGDGTTNVGQIMTVHVNTLNTTAGSSDHIYLWAENQATGTVAVAERTLNVAYQTDISDATGGDASAAFAACMQSNNGYTFQPRDTDGPTAVDARTLFTDRGTGIKIDVRNKGTTYAPTHVRLTGSTGLWSYLAVDGGSAGAAVEARTVAKNISTAYGVMAYTYAGSTVPVAYGGYFRTLASEGTLTPVGIGLYGQAVCASGGSGTGVSGRADNDDAENVGVSGTAQGLSSASNYGIKGQAANGATNYAVYGYLNAPSKTTWGGFFIGKVGADSCFVPADAVAPISGEKTRTRIETKVNSEVGQYIDIAGQSTNVGSWINGGALSEHDYGLYIDGCEYGITQTSTSATNALSGVTTLQTAVLGTVYLQDSGGMANAGKATVASGADTVRVTCGQAISEDENTITLTALNRSPDGGTPYVVLRAGSFTIHCTTNQGAAQAFHWTIFKR